MLSKHYDDLAFHSKMIDALILPDHFKTAAQRAADKKSRDTSGEKPSKRDTSQVLKKA